MPRFVSRVPALCASLSLFACVAVPAKVADKLSDATVPEAEVLISKAKQSEQLDVLEKAELEGKNRKGVLEQIAKRREELKG